MGKGLECTFSAISDIFFVIIMVVL